MSRYYWQLLVNLDLCSPNKNLHFHSIAIQLFRFSLSEKESTITSAI